MQTPPSPDIPQIPEMVGATDTLVHLGNNTTHVNFRIHPPTGPAFLGPDQPPRGVILLVENVTSDTVAPVYYVYLNLPPDEPPEKRPDLNAGMMAMFGIVQASQERPDHPDNGLAFSLNATEVYARLVAQRRWDNKNLRVSFVPTPPREHPVDVRVGRVSLYFK